MFNCFSAACGAKGSVFDFYIRKQALTGSPSEQFRTAFRAVAEFAGVAVPGAGESVPLSDADVIAWHEDLMKNKVKLKFLKEKRGLTDETIAAFRLGWDGERITIPVFDEEGNLINVRRYLSTGGKYKMLGLTGHNERRLFRPVAEREQEIILTEGELDCIIAVQEGFNADTVTSGAGNWKDEFTPRFRDKRVVIVYDNDDTGRRGAQLVGRILQTVTPAVFVLAWPDNFKAKGDVTDYFVELGGSREDFRKLLATAPPFVPIKDEKEWGFRYPLTDLGNSERMVARYGDVLKWVDSWGKWLSWIGDPVWKIDESKDATNRAIETIRLMSLEADELTDDKAKVALRKFALLSEGERKISATVTLARAKLAVRPDQLNRDPWTLNLPNGVLDLKKP